MTEHERIVKSLEGEIARLQKQLLDAKRTENSLWNSVFEKCREMRISSKNAKVLSNYVSELIYSWSKDQGAKFTNAYKGSSSAPGFIECLNRLVAAVESPDPALTFEPIPTVPTFRSAPVEEPVLVVPPEAQVANEEKEDVTPTPSAAAAAAQASTVPEEKFNPFSRRVNIPTPFATTDTHS